MDTIDDGTYLAHLHSQPYFIERIKNSQFQDPQVLKKKISLGDKTDFRISDMISCDLGTVYGYQRIQI